MVTLATQLELLENAQLVRRLPEEELAYMFKHALTQEAAYDSLLLKRRRDLHRLAAEAYERFYPDRLDENAALLAQHYQEAGDDAKTLEYATRAGDAAARLYANAEALMHYDQAIDISRRFLGDGSRDKERARVGELQSLYLKRGQVLELSGKYDEALRNYDELAAVAETLGTRELQLSALLARATLYSTPTSVFAPDEGRNLLNHVLSIARELGDHIAQVQALWNLELLSWFSGRPSESVEYGEQAVTLARQFHLDERLAYALNDLALPRANLGQIKRARAELDEARTLWQTLDNKPMLADNLATSTLVDYLMGDFDQAIHGSAEAFNLSATIGNLWDQSYSLMWVGYVYWDRGDVGQAIQALQQCIGLGEEVGFIAPLVTQRADLGWLYASCGDLQQGLALARLALDQARQSLQFITNWGLVVLARIYLLMGNIDLAQEQIDQVIALRESQHGTELALGGGSFALAEMELTLARDDPVRARDLSDKYLRYLRASHIRAALPETLYLKGQALVRLGEFEAARSALIKACVVSKKLGARFRLWRILAALSELEAQVGNPAEADKLSIEARAHVTYIAEHMPPDLRIAFMSMPQVRVVSGDPA